MKSLVLVCSLMLLVLTTIAQVKPRPRTPLPVNKGKADTTVKSTQSPVILNNRNIKNVDPKQVQANQPIGSIEVQNIQQQKEINNAGEEIKKTPPKANVLITPGTVEVMATLPKKYKLKITTTDIQRIKKSNTTAFEQYKINQLISYNTLGKIQIPEYHSFGRISVPEEENAPQKGNYYIVKERPYVYIRVGSDQRESGNINRSFVYTLNESEINDPNAKMVISTWVSEMTGKKPLNFDYEHIFTEVPIKNVLAVLMGKRVLNATKSYFDTDIARGIKFDDFGGFNMYLTRVNYPDKIILEGPIRRRTNSGKEKAAVWVRFELVE